jgi:hypothetical protein
MVIRGGPEKESIPSEEGARRNALSGNSTTLIEPPGRTRLNVCLLCEVPYGSTGFVRCHSSSHEPFPKQELWETSGKQLEPEPERLDEQNPFNPL